MGPPDNGIVSECYILKKDLDKWMRSIRSPSSKTVASTIIYVATKAECNTITQILANKCEDIQIGKYHADLSLAERDDTYDSHSSVSRAEITQTFYLSLFLSLLRNRHRGFLCGRIPVVVATTAFGMGIDKPVSVTTRATACS